MLPRKNEFDAELAIVETRNMLRILSLHLERCDNVVTADAITKQLEAIFNAFQQKVIDLNRVMK